jgi:hypothetical protein
VKIKTLNTYSEQVGRRGKDNEKIGYKTFGKETTRFTLVKRPQSVGIP